LLDTSMAFITPFGALSPLDYLSPAQFEKQAVK
jgi:hypothetical protein